MEDLTGEGRKGKEGVGGGGCPDWQNRAENSDGRMEWVTRLQRQLDAITGRYLSRKPPLHSPQHYDHTHNNSDTGCGGFLHIKKFSNMIWYEYLINQYNSDTLHPELVQSPQTKGSVSQDFPSRQVPILSSESPGNPQFLSEVVTNQRFPWSLP